MESAVSPRGFEYQVGRKQVPVDVFRPRRRTPMAAVPVVVATEREPTAPIRMDPRGPGRAEIERLAAGRVETVELSGRYRLGRLLGKGGMAKVFEAEQLSLGRAVAVKILDERGDRPEALRRFLTEARVTASLRHPNVVEVSDFGSTPEGLVYLVMELLEGEDLRQMIEREGPLSWARARAIMLELCAGLAVAHERGVVHRDLKPSNCFRVATPDGERIKLLDFGIAVSVAAGPEDTIVGTPEYMSPEQARGDEVDPRSDIYALGILLAELLTAKVPFSGKTAAGIINAQIEERPPALADLAGFAIEPRIQAIYTKALAKSPGRRFADVHELAAAIAAIPAELGAQEQPRVGVFRRLRSLAATAALALLA